MAKPKFAAGSLWTHPAADFLLFRVVETDSDTVTLRSPFAALHHEDNIVAELDKARSALDPFEYKKPERVKSYPVDNHPKVKIGYQELRIQSVDEIVDLEHKGITEHAPKAFEHHAWQPRYDLSSGGRVLRRDRFARPDGSAYRFDLVLTDGNLLFTGDVGDLWLQSGDPVKYASERIDYPEDLARKVIGRKDVTHKWSADAAMAWAVAHATHRIGHRIFEKPVEVIDEGKLDDAGIELKDVLEWAEFGRDAFWAKVYHDTSWDIDEPPDLSTFSTTFTWFREALRCAVRLGWGS